MLDLNGDGYVDVKEFIHGFFKVYYSNLDTKIKLAFDMYVLLMDAFTNPHSFINPLYIILINPITNSYA